MSVILPRSVSSVSIPNRPAFRAQEVCDIAGIQPYVLRGWEAEFPDLGVARTPSGARIYRRVDVERVLRLKHLILVDGLTLAGARRRLADEAAPQGETAEELSDALSLLDDEARRHLRTVREGLQWILKTLDGSPAAGFVLAADTPARPESRTSKTRKKK